MTLYPRGYPEQVVKPHASLPRPCHMSALVIYHRAHLPPGLVVKFVCHSCHPYASFKREPMRSCQSSLLMPSIRKGHGVRKDIVLAKYRALAKDSVRKVHSSRKWRRVQFLRKSFAIAVGQTRQTRSIAGALIEIGRPIVPQIREEPFNITG